MSDIYIIAEAAQGYEGSVEISKLLIRSAKVAGANAIKFQVIYADDLAEKEYEHYKLFQSLEMSEEGWLQIRNFAKSQDIDFIIDVFGEKSLELTKKIKPTGVKVHSTCFFDECLTSDILSLDCAVYFSIGGIHVDEIQEKIAKYHLNKRRNFAILYGFQSEPTPLSSNNLLRISQLRQELGIDNIGFMDHSDGQGRHTITLSAVALGLGVKLFEKHITLDRQLQMEDYVSALGCSDFSIYVTSLRELNEALGKSSLILSADEISYRNKAVKRVIAKEDLPVGAIISLEHVRLNRPGKMEGAFKISEVIGKKVIAPVTAGTVITQEVISHG